MNILLAVLLLGVANDSGENTELTAKYIVRDNVCNLQFSGERKVLVQFSEFCRTVNNKDWRSNSEQVLRQKILISQLDEDGMITIRVTAIKGLMDDVARVEESNKRQQKGLDAWKGKIKWINRIPGPSGI